MKQDRDKWDRRYRERGDSPVLPDPFLIAHADLLKSGRALDPACGLGGNALFLAARGYQVDAIDISFVAMSRLRAHAHTGGLDVACLVADLDDFPLPVERYDLAVVFRFFSQQFIYALKASLKSGGLLIYSTFNIKHIACNPRFNPAYLIQPEDLQHCFSDFSVLVHEPEAGDCGNISRFIGRKQVDQLVS